MESDASEKATAGSKVSSPEIISTIHYSMSLSHNSYTIVTSRYLHKPYLISGSKFDLRIYVYVTSYDPLRIYIFSDGLVRFASCKSVFTHPRSDKYYCKLYRLYMILLLSRLRYSSSMKTLSNKFMHLTNYSVNKKNSEYQTNSDDKACQGHKW